MELNNKVDIKGKPPKSGDIILFAGYRRQLYKVIFAGFGNGYSVQYYDIDQRVLDFFKGLCKWGGKSYVILTYGDFIIIDESFLNEEEKKIYEEIKKLL